jgi:hypothetical protein
VAYNGGMQVLNWFTQHWFDCIETLGVVGSLLFTARIAHKDERAQQISNMFTVNEAYNSIWSRLGEPALARIRKKEVNLQDHPVTDQEWAFVTMLLLHLDTVRRASQAGLFITLERLPSDVRNFLSLPLPWAVWQNIRTFQNEEFVEFIETVMKTQE